MIITFFRYIYFESLKCLLTHNDGLRHSARAEEERSGREVEEEETEGIKDRKSIQSLEIS